jgi:CRISPR/Cas system CMR-associated protein Cmr1 (group 7 of RAMP superfamily)
LEIIKNDYNIVDLPATEGIVKKKRKRNDSEFEITQLLETFFSISTPQIWNFHRTAASPLYSTLTNVKQYAHWN